MRAVTFTFSIPKYLLGKALGGLSDAVVFGAPSAVSLADLAQPELPDESWVSVEMIAGGICGTDIGNLVYAASPILEPFASFPAVMGHEILARVVDVGPAVTRVRPGQRVAVDPIVSCAVRGYGAADMCPACTGGNPGACARSAEKGRLTVGGRPMGAGISVGYHRDLPGGWGERLIAHESQIYPVSDAIDDRTAALIEPLAVATHAVLRNPPAAGERVLVIGSGSIALATVWALRALGHDGELVAQTKRPQEAELARRLGAGEAVAPGGPARDALLATGARAYKPPVGPEVFAGGGYPLVFDCVASRASLDQALRFAAGRGRIVMLGCAAVLRRLDLTLVWARELSVLGSLGYGTERWEGESLHTFEVVQRLLSATGAPVADLVTHTYPLSQYRDALAAARHHRTSGAVKVLLQP
jgi:threonine dehydrogenase-like Zn-dependent dehydrogenase